MHPVSPLQEQHQPQQQQEPPQTPTTPPTPAKSTKVGRWTEEEHTIFCKGMTEYPKQWKTIAAMVKTRTVVQIRTHAQKCWTDGMADGSTPKCGHSDSARTSSPRPVKKRKNREDRLATLLTPERKEPLPLELSMAPATMDTNSKYGLGSSPTSVTDSFNIFNQGARTPAGTSCQGTRLSFSLENSPEAYKGTLIPVQQPNSLSLNAVDPMLLQKPWPNQNDIVSLMNDDFSSAEHDLLLSIPDVFE